MYIKTVAWGKCNGSNWCNFLTLNLDHPLFSGLEGVYVIWHGGPAPGTVYVGQGLIAERLRSHRTDSRILKHAVNGLFVTWAQVDALSRDGVERFLTEKLGPKEVSRTPEASPINVNLPW
jgi:hypothetical protein